MAADPRPPRRPQTRSVAGSRTATSRPRKVAGRAQSPTETESTPGDQTDAADAVDLSAQPEASEDQAQVEPEPDDGPDTDDAELDQGLEDKADDADPEAAPDRETSVSRRPLRIAVAAIVVLVLAISAEGWYLFGPPSDPPVVSGERPVVADDLSQSVALETAAESATMIVSRSYETYDEEVEAAASTMTEAFAQEYRTTTGDIQDAFVEAETEVSVEVVSRSVVRASSQQVEALLFLNQFVTKDGGDAVYTPYRALATMVKTDQGWLIDDLDTR